MHVDRRAVIRGHSSTTTSTSAATAVASNATTTTTYHIVFVGVSHTLGVVERETWCRPGGGDDCESRAYFNAIVWFGHGGAVVNDCETNRALGSGSRSALAIANLLAGGAVARNVAEIPTSSQLGYCPETRAS
ncbi:hypothetical protein Pelo_17784 [Pelomyxa schiedti]|nr:hypothetical protein Pelo_17784 [Pelomyxa schiedti]